VVNGEEKRQRQPRWRDGAQKDEGRSSRQDARDPGAPRKIGPRLRAGVGKLEENSFNLIGGSYTEKPAITSTQLSS
jgi:hypothetical protein